MDWRNKITLILKADKNKKEKWLIFLLIGVLLVVVALPVETDQEKQDDKEEELVSEMDESYISQMERQLETVLQNVKGVGKVSVMITISESAEKIVEKDEETSISTTTNTDTGNCSATDRKESAVYSGGTGEEVPYVVKEISPKVEGVLVVAEGGDNAVVIENISEAVQALFGIDPHKIKVMKHD